MNNKKIIFPGIVLAESMNLELAIVPFWEFMDT